MGDIPLTQACAWYKFKDGEENKNYHLLKLQNNKTEYARIIKNEIPELYEDFISRIKKIINKYTPEKHNIIVFFPPSKHQDALSETCNERSSHKNNTILSFEKDIIEIDKNIIFYYTCAIDYYTRNGDKTRPSIDEVKSFESISKMPDQNKINIFVFIDDVIVLGNTANFCFKSTLKYLTIKIPYKKFIIALARKLGNVDFKEKDGDLYKINLEI